MIQRERQRSLDYRKHVEANPRKKKSKGGFKPTKKRTGTSRASAKI
jgi:hypothetical protein